MEHTAHIPAEFVARMAALLGDELDAFLRALAAPEEGLRVNTLRTDAGEFSQKVPFSLEPFQAVREGFVVRSGAPGKHPYHFAGAYYLQDPSAMIVGSLVGAKPGERVLDLAAAPGGKATHLATRMAGEGVLVANDLNRARARELASNLERFGVRNAVVLAETPDRLAAHFGAWFDRVLVDAPCSGESMFHKSAAAMADWSPAAVTGCARRQSELLRTAAQLVRPGGTLLYSTCTFAPEENELVMEEFLAESRGFEPAPLPPLADAAPVAFGCTDPTPSAYRLWPHRVPGAGHFVAAVRRCSESEATAPSPSRKGISKDAVVRYASFLRDTYGYDRSGEGLALLGRELHEIPPGTPDLSRLRLVRPGLWCGTVLKDRFEPAHSLALATPIRRARGEVTLAPNDERVEQYLSGHPIRSAGPSGWVPVAVDEFPLGWGKRVGSTVKNHYPKGLRLRGLR